MSTWYGMLINLASFSTVYVVYRYENLSMVITALMGLAPEVMKVLHPTGI